MHHMWNIAVRRLLVQICEVDLSRNLIGELRKRVIFYLMIAKLPCVVYAVKFPVNVAITTARK